VLFPEANVLHHDLLADGPIEADLHLLHRVDTEFGDQELRAVLARFREPVLLVPALLLTRRVLARELLVRVLHRHATRAGWVRNVPALRALWEPTHRATEIAVGDGRAFLLRRVEA
jgi:hypothetical protein